jgi:crotonobetainyl-CoA:carnitine CoA-transferase CaiB-like acyl-CoA transferase
MRHGAIEFRSEHYLTVDGEAPALYGDPLFGAYRAGDDRFVRLHMNFQHHRENVLEFLGCAPTRASIEEALKTWDAVAFETAAYEHGCVVAAMRSPAEWGEHPQAAAVAASPVVQIERIGEAPPRSLPTGARSLEGLRVLDLTRIIAGPVAGRALAAHGAEVMRISAPGLPFIDWLAKDTGRGKLSAYADIAKPDGRAALARLV